MTGLGRSVDDQAAFLVKNRDHTKILGIVNITADSFSDGGRYLAPEDAIAHAVSLVEDGADIIDLGPASSHPDAAPVTAEQEIERLEPVISALEARNIPISVDSFQPETQRFALSRNVAFLNDIQGFPDPALYPDLARADCRLIVMHSVQAHGGATRIQTDATGLPDTIDAFFIDRVGALTSAGVDPERIILDPGMGFFLGETPDASLSVLNRLPRLKQRFGLPLLISVSRKSFLRAITGRPVERTGPATLAAELFAVQAGADYIRTHDAGALRDGLRIWSGIREYDTNSALSDS